MLLIYHEKIESEERRIYKTALLIPSTVLRQEHTGPTAGRLKRLGRLGRGREQICLVCSAASEAFGAAFNIWFVLSFQFVCCLK